MPNDLQPDSKVSGRPGPVGAPLGDRGVPGGSGAMFDGIAPRYDFLNRLVSLGLDQRWRRRAVALLGCGPGAAILDLATGTADLAIAAARGVPGSHVVGVDPSAEMLRVGRVKVERAGLSGRVSLREGDACRLPFASASFDGVTMGFGIRNVPDRNAALREIARVLRPGARVVLLEGGPPRPGLLGAGARLYLVAIVPRLAALVGGSGAEYRYLHDSMADFPAPAAFADQMRACGLVVHRVVPLIAGAAHLYCGEAPER